MNEGVDSAATLSLEIDTQGAEGKLFKLAETYALFKEALDGVAPATGLKEVGAAAVEVDARIKTLEATLAAMQAAGDGAAKGVSVAMSAAAGSIAGAIKLPEDAVAEFKSRFKLLGEESVAALQKGLTTSNIGTSYNLMAGYETGTVASLERVKLKVTEALSYLETVGAASAQNKFGALPFDAEFAKSVDAKLASLSELSQAEIEYGLLGAAQAELALNRTLLFEFKKTEAVRASAAERAALEADYAGLGSASDGIAASRIALTEFNKAEAVKASAKVRAETEAEYAALGATSDEIAASNFVLLEHRKTEAAVAAAKERVLVNSQYAALGVAADNVSSGRNAVAEWNALQAKEAQTAAAALLAAQTKFGDEFNALLAKQAKEAHDIQGAQIAWELDQTASNNAKKLALEREYILASEKQRLQAAINASKLITSGYTGNITQEFAPSTLATAAASTTPALEKQLLALTPATVAATAAQKEWNAVGGEAHAVARGLSGSLGQLWMTYGQLVPLLAGAALGAGFRSALKDGAEFEYQLTFAKALGGATADEVTRLSEAALSLGQASIKGPVELAHGLQIMAQAGLSAKDALSALPTVLNLSVVGEMSMEESARTLIGVMNAFKLETTDMPHIGDVFAKAASLSQTSVQGLTQAMATASVIGTQYGVNMEDAATALTLLAKANVQNTAAGTALKQVMKDIYTPAPKGQKMLDILGVDSQSEGKLKSFVDIVYELKDEIVKYDAPSQTKIIGQIFDQKAAKEFVVMMQQTREEWDKTRGTITNSSGFMSSVSAELQATTLGVFKQAKNTLEADLISAFMKTDGAAHELAVSLRSLFASEQFKTDLTAMVGAMSGLLEILVKVAPALIYAGEAWVLLKGISVLNGILMGVGTALGLVGGAAATAAVGVTALEGAAIATGTAVAGSAVGAGALATAFGALATPAAAIVVALGAMYLAHKAWVDATPDSVKAAERFNTALDGQISRLKAANVELQKRLGLQKDGSNADVDAQAKIVADLKATIAGLDVKIDANGGDSVAGRFLNKTANTIRRDAAIEALTATESKMREATSLQEDSSKLTLQNYAKDQLATLDKTLAAATAHSKTIDATIFKSLVAQLDPRLETQALLVLKQRIEDEGRKLAQDAAQTGSKVLTDPAKGGKDFDISLYVKTQEGLLDLDKQRIKEAEDLLNAQYKGKQITEDALIRGIAALEQQKQMAIAQTKLNELEAIKPTSKQFLNAKGEYDESKYLDFIQGYKKAWAKAQDEIPRIAEEADAKVTASHNLMFLAIDKDNASLMGKEGSYADQYANNWTKAYQAKYDEAQKALANAGEYWTPDLEYAQKLIKELDGLKARYKQVGEAKDIAKQASTEITTLQGQFAAIDNKWSGGLLSGLQKDIEKTALLKTTVDSLQTKADTFVAMHTSYGDEEAAKILKSIAEANKNAAKTSADAWKQAGTDIADSLTKAFGKGGAALGDMFKAATSYASAQKQIDKDLADSKRAAGTDPAKIAAAEKEALDNQGQASVAMYANMAGAAKGFFNEQSDGYKILNGLEKTMHLFQLANMYERLYTSLFVTTGSAAGVVAGQVVETSAVVAGQAAQNTAKVPGVFMSFMSALGPWGAAAAAVAIAAVLGGAFSGGGAPTVTKDAFSAQTANDGSGTVFGDSKAQSQSIANSLKSLESMAKPELSFIGQMVTLLKSIDTSLAGATNKLISSGFDALGSSFQGTKTASSTLWGLFGSDSSSTSLADVGLAFAKQTVEEAMKSVQLQQYQTTKTDWSSSGFLGLGSESGTNYNTSLSGVDAAVGASMSKIVTSLVTAVETIGAKMGSTPETLASVGSTDTGLGKVSLMGKTGDEINKTLSAVFSALGDKLATIVLPSIAEFQTMGEGALQTLVRVASTFESVTSTLGDFGMSIKLTGLDAIRASMNLVDLAGGFDKFTKDSADYYANFFTDAERNANSVKALGTEFATLGVVMPATRDEFRKLVEVQDPATESGQRMIAALLGMEGAFAAVTKSAQDIASEHKGLQDQLDNLTKTSTELLTKQRDALDASNRALFDQVQAVTAAKAAASALQTFIDAMGTFATSLRAFRDGLMLGALSPLSPANKYAEARTQYQTTLTAAQGGDTTAQGNLQSAATTFLTASQVANASNAQYQADFALVKQDIGDTATWADEQVKTGKDSLKALNSTVTWLGTVNTSVLSIKDAINALGSSLAALNVAKGGLGSSPIDYKSSAGASYTAANDSWASTNGSDKWTTSELKSFIAANNAAGNNLGIYNAAKANGFSLSTVDVLAGAPPGAAEAWAKANGLPSFAVGTNELPADMNIRAHEGERIVPPADNRELMARLRDPQANSAALLAEIKALREEVKSLRSDQQSQTGAIISGNYDANNRAAEKVTTGTVEAAKATAWAKKSGAKLK